MFLLFFTMNTLSEFAVCVVGIYCSFQTFINLGRRHSEIHILREKLSLAKEQVKVKEREEEEEEVRRMVRSRRREE